jgi:hypothetical protein
MIRIRTKINDKRVLTIHSGNEWVTLITGLQTVTSNSLLEAGQVHLAAAKLLKNKED